MSMISKDRIEPAQTLEVVSDPTTINQSLFNRINSWTVGKGELSFPCVPAMLEKYLEQLQQLFITLGKPWSPAELEQLRQLMAKKLAAGFQESPHSRLIVRYETDKFPSIPSNNLVLSVNTHVSTMEEEYKRWTQVRTPPLFGKYPDAKVMAVAKTLGEPTQSPILDVGAGTGRNTMPLGRLGYPVLALEMVPAFLRQLASEVNREGLPVMVAQGNILSPKIQLPTTGYKLAVVAEVISHFRNLEQLRQLFTKMSEVIRPGGFLLLNGFLTLDGYQPTQLVREVAQVMWSYFYTPEEMAAATAGLPLELVSDESVFDYEKQHLPAEAWPPTGWFVQWSTGGDIFPLTEGKPPVELRWLLYRRT
jgi:SAM-dependent methyltransferase